MRRKGPAKPGPPHGEAAPARFPHPGELPRAQRGGSRAVEQALAEKLDRLEPLRLARECAKLDPAAEKALAHDVFNERSGTVIAVAITSRPQRALAEPPRKKRRGRWMG